MKTQSPTELLAQEQIEVLQEIHQIESLEEREEREASQDPEEWVAEMNRLAIAAELAQSETNPSAQD